MTTAATSCPETPHQTVEQLVRRYAPMVFNACLRITGNRHDAEDAAQAVFLRLSQHTQEAGEIRSMAAWLYQVACRVSLDVRRGRHRRCNHERSYGSTLGNGRLDRDPVQEAHEMELQAIVIQALNELPGKYRLPLILHYYGGLTHEELAEELGCNPQTLRVRLHRGHKMLQDRLRKRRTALSSLWLPIMLASAITHRVARALARSATCLGQQFVQVGHAAGPEVLALGAGICRRMIAGKSVIIAVVMAIAGGVAAGPPLWAKLQKGLASLPELRAPSSLWPTLQAPVPRLSDMTGAKPDKVRPSGPTASDPPALVVSPAVAEADAALRRIAPPPGRMPVNSGADKLAMLAHPPVENPLDRRSPGPWPPSPVWPMTPGRPEMRLPGTQPADSWASAALSGSTLKRAAPPSPSRGQGGAHSPHNHPADDDRGSSILTGSIGSADIPPLALVNTVTVGPTAISAWAPGRPVMSPTADAFPTGAAFVLDNNGQVLSQSAHDIRDLRLVSAIQNTIDNPADGVNGWFAMHGGRIMLPQIPVLAGTHAYNWGEDPNDQSIDLINSVRLTLNRQLADGVVELGLLATDSQAIPTLPGGHHFIGVWSFSNSSEAARGIDLSIRYDSTRLMAEGLDEAAVKLWYYDTEWHRILDAAADAGNHTINGHIPSATFFAVSTPEPSGLLPLIVGGLMLLRRRRRH